MSRNAFDIEAAWTIAAHYSRSVCDLDGGGYAVPVERSRKIKPPSRTKPIRALVPSGEVLILPVTFGIWRIVTPRASRARRS